MSERKGKTLVGDDWASVSKFQKIKKNVQVSPFWQGMLHCVTPVQEICFFASVDFTGKYFLSESAMFPDRRRSDSCRKFLGQLFIWLPPPENYKSPSGCCTRCFKCSSCSWNHVIVNISLKNQCWCFCWIFTFTLSFTFTTQRPSVTRQARCAPSGPDA